MFSVYVCLIVMLCISGAFSFSMRQPMALSSRLSLTSQRLHAEAPGKVRHSFSSLVRAMDLELGEKSSVEKVLKHFFKKVKEEVMDKDNEIVIQNFGKFKKVTRDARTGRNPLTGEAIDIPETSNLKFYASDALKMN